MPRQCRGMEGLIPGSCKIRKRGCTSSSSSSSRVHHYRFKRAILVGKARGIGSRSSTPVPTWKTTPLLSAVDSPKYAGSHCGSKSKPVSVRKLAATLWEMNEMPSPKLRESSEEKKSLLRRESEMKTRDKMRSVHSGSLPPHLSDPSHSPVSERFDRSGTGSRHRRASSISQKLKQGDHNVGILDSVSCASLMEIETRSRVQTPRGSSTGVRNRLKDISNALTTSKELLKIINRIWAHDDLPSSSMSLISALHAELERARLQVNQLIHDQRSDQNEINYLMKCLAEEKAAWKDKEKQAVEAAIETIAGELEVERKLRRRLESLNKKLGKELAETKTSFLKSVKELDSEKRAREIMEQMCDDLARDINENRTEVEERKRESVNVHEEVERERGMLHIADLLHEEKVQMKLLEAKYHYGGKDVAVEGFSNQLETFLRGKRHKDKGCDYQNRRRDAEIETFLDRTRIGSRLDDGKKDEGEVDDGEDCEIESAESDLHSIELHMDNNNKNTKWTYPAVGSCDSRRASIDGEVKARISTSGKVPRKSISLQRSISDGVEWGLQTDGIQKSDGLDQERFHEFEKQAQRSYGDEMQRYKSVKSLRDSVLSNSRTGPATEFPSPTRQWGQGWSLRDPCNTIPERCSTVQVGGGLKSRLGEARAEGQNSRRSKR